VLTKDGVPIARHEPLFGATAVNGVAVPPTNEYTTTNIFDRPEFASRLRTRTLDGTSITGFWSDDFTLAEVKTLRARERIPALRPGNVAFDDQFEIPTLQEVIDLAQRESLNTGRTIGIYPETKHPTFFLQNAANRTNPARFEDVVVDALHAAYGNSASAPVFLQSFEVANLQYLAPRTEIRLVQLLGGGSARPYDFVVTGDARTYRDLISPAGLQFVNDYAAGIGPTRDLLIPRPGNVLGAPTTAVADAHAAGLLVHPYTFRAENGFLSAGFRVGANPAALGDYVGETVLYLQLGVDGFFTDQPTSASRRSAPSPPSTSCPSRARWYCWPPAASRSWSRAGGAVAPPSAESLAPASLARARPPCARPTGRYVSTRPAPGSVSDYPPTFTRPPCTRRPTRLPC
jgi:glycerophosphoryl diester phosphodiesterase